MLQELLTAASGRATSRRDAVGCFFTLSALAGRCTRRAALLVGCRGRCVLQASDGAFLPIAALATILLRTAIRATVAANLCTNFAVGATDAAIVLNFCLLPCTASEGDSSSQHGNNSSNGKQFGNHVRSSVCLWFVRKNVGYSGHAFH